VEYRLSPDAVLSRARASAALATASSIAPAVFTVLALYKMDLVPKAYLAIVLGLLTLLAAARIAFGYTQLKKHLAAFVVRLTDDPDDVLMIDTRRGRFDIPRPSITRVREIDGALVGLRVELKKGWDGDTDSPELVDIPRGGMGFGELRASLDRIKPVERPRKNSRIARIAVAVLVVAGIFFLPFFLDDLFGRSKMLAVGLVLVVWVGLRVVVRR